MKQRPHGTRRATFAALTISFSLVAAACSGDDPPVAEPTTTPASTTTTTEAASDAPAAESTTTVVAGAEPAVVAARWLQNTSGYDTEILDQLGEPQVVSAGPVSHVEYSHTIGDRRVLDSEIVVHVLADGTVQGATESLITAPPLDADLAVDLITARGYAEKAVEGNPVPDSDVEAVWDRLGDQLIPAWLVSLSTTGPAGAWRVVIDATTGNVLSADRAAEGAGKHSVLRNIGDSLPMQLPAQVDACDSGSAPSACVWYNPFAQNGGDVDPRNVDSFLFPVELLGLTDDGQLSGEFVDTNFPGTPVPPDGEPDGTWSGGVGSRTFEAAMAYYWLDRTQRFVQELGFQIRTDEPTEIVPVFPAEIDNAFFDAIEDRIYMGVGSNGINAAQDAFVLIHEYGHAILDAQVGTETHFSSQQISSYSEGFSDLFAALSTVELHQGDPACVGGWFGFLNDCFRNLDNTKVYPDDLTFAVHEDGELFAGAVWDVFQRLLATEGLTPSDCSSDAACLPIRDRMMQIVLGSHYYLTAGADFFDIANAYLRANEAAFGDADRGLIESAFEARGLLGEGRTSIPREGGVPDAPTDVTLTIDIAHDYRGDIRLSAGVVDSNFEVLCEEIVLAEPDTEDSEDNLFGTVDVSDTDCAQFVPPSPDQLWYLFAADELSDDEGEIVEFVVNVGDAPYPAVDLPRLIPDGDPEGVAVIVDGSAETVSEDGQVEPGAPVADQPFITLDITHTYTGDLFIRAGVADADDNIICSVPIRNPDPSDTSGGLIGSVDMAECAELFPPAPSRQWFLQVIDSAARDTGTVDGYSLTGPDGEEFEFDNVPVTVPDNDDDGVALILTDSGSASGEAGGAGQSSTLELPVIAVDVEHTFVGDLAITAGVADADLNPICEVVVRTPDSEDSSDNLSGEASLAECGRFYPPSPDQLWYLFVRDTLDNDVGTVERFTLQGPDGQVFDSADAGVAIPDSDQAGVALLIDGSESGVATEGTALASLIIEHTYVGDLFVEVGVTDQDANSLCGINVRIPDPNNDSVDLAETIDMTECVQRGFYPPSPDQLWFVFAQDSEALDTGAITQFSLIGPDGVVRTANNTPRAIPDNTTDDGAFVAFQF